MPLPSSSNPASNQTSPERYDAIFVAPGTSLYYFSWHPVVDQANGSSALSFLAKAFPSWSCLDSKRAASANGSTFRWKCAPGRKTKAQPSSLSLALADRGIRIPAASASMKPPPSPSSIISVMPAPGFEYVSADPITIACRGSTSARELELMRLACDATFDVFRAVLAAYGEGCHRTKSIAWIDDGFAKMNLKRRRSCIDWRFSCVTAAAPLKPQTLKPGDIVLIDGGTKVEGYESDVTRTIVFGAEPSDKLVHVFDTLRGAQDAALDATRAGRLSGTVDDAARAVVTSAGYGPDYKLFSHRLGHGISSYYDGHEHPYLVRGSKTVLEVRHDLFE